jgi:hypothetical protein
MQEVQREHRKKKTGSSSDTIGVAHSNPAEKAPNPAIKIKEEPAQENGSSKAFQPLRVLIVAQHVRPMPLLSMRPDKSSLKVSHGHSSSASLWAVLWASL